jgi:hypothetical protein
MVEEAEAAVGPSEVAGGQGRQRQQHQPAAPLFVPRGVLSTAETCYISAVLQALAASPSVTAYFGALASAAAAGGDENDGDDDDVDSPQDDRLPLALALASLLQQLSTSPPSASSSSSSVAPVDPSAAIAALAKHHPDFARAQAREHQDAAEALEAVVAAVAAEARAWLRARVAPALSGLAAVLPEAEEEEEEEDEVARTEQQQQEQQQQNLKNKIAAAASALLRPAPRLADAAAVAARAAEAAAAAAAAAARAAVDAPLLDAWRALASPPLDGQLLHLRVCMSCGNRAERALAPFSALPLPVPAAADADGLIMPTVRPGASLDDCMRMFTGQELLSGVRCVRCGLRRALAAAELAAAAVLPPPTPEQAAARRELVALAAGGAEAGPLADDDVVDLRALARRAGLPPLGLGGGARAGAGGGGPGGGGGKDGGSSSVLRQTVICRAPPVLALQLLRARPGQRKLSGRIAYPALMDISGFVLAGEERAAAAAAAAAAGDDAAAAAAPSLLYELVAVVQHLGLGTGSGHYVTYRRVGGGGSGGGSNSWVRASDRRVDLCSADEALGCDGAALLLYERVELLPSFGGGGGRGGIPLVTLSPSPR